MSSCDDRCLPSQGMMECGRNARRPFSIDCYRACVVPNRRRLQQFVRRRGLFKRSRFIAASIPAFRLVGPATAASLQRTLRSCRCPAAPCPPPANAATSSTAIAVPNRAGSSTARRRRISPCSTARNAVATRAVVAPATDPPQLSEYFLPRGAGGSRVGQEEARSRRISRRPHLNPPPATGEEVKILR